MKKLIQQFPEQLEQALSIARASLLSIGHAQVREVLVSGLGGSGIGATIVQEYVYDKVQVPFTVNKTYFIPKYTGQATLFIACSYSGNTEETLQAVSDARRCGAQIVCITSGGALAEFAHKHKLDLIRIPSGMPPRACLGYSIVQLLHVLKKAGLLKARYEREIAAAADGIRRETKTLQTKAKKIAQLLYGKHVAIYGMAGQEGLMIRFRQQINENSKALCWHNVIPEMTHNEIVGWRAPHPDVAVLYCFSPNEFDRNLTRLRILKGVVKSYTPHSADVAMSGDTWWERAFHFIHLTDWVSVFLAELYEQDAVEVKVIDHLKGAMAKK